MRSCGWMPAMLLAMALGGCSREEPPREQTGQLPEDPVFSGQVQALEKAKDVQNTLDQGAARMRESVERQERP